MTDGFERLDDTRDALEDDTAHPTDANDRDGWQLRDLDSATYASRKAAREIERVDAWEERQIELIRAAPVTERARERSTLEFFEGALAQYLAQLIRDGRKTKTLDLLHGKIAIRRRQECYERAEARSRGRCKQ